MNCFGMLDVVKQPKRMWMKDGGTAMEKNIKCNACGRRIQEENGILKEIIEVAE